MKNLKKVLSLALAFAMVLGLCVVGSAETQDVTTLADWDEVEDKDAALLLNTFNIMQGNEDGTFAPNDNVTRAQAAKMISVALWGGSDDAALYSSSNIGGYPDVVAGSWYMGYVNYMTVQGIMQGDDSGTFRPEGNVTGYELLKMCLVALGYNAETEMLTGAGWDIRTMALATKPGFQNLTEGTTVTDWSQPLSRMNAARIISNMIYRQMVSYSLVGAGSTNATAIVTTTGHNSFGEDVLGMKVTTGTLVANPYGNLDSETIDTELRGYEDENAIVSYKVNPTDATPKTAHLTLDSTAADLGANVTVFLVSKDKGTTYSIVSAKLVAPTEVEPSLKVSGSSVVMNNDNRKADGTPDVAYYVNNETKTIGDVWTVSSGKVAPTAAATEILAQDVDGDGYIDIVKAYTLTLNTVKATGTDKTGDYVTFSGDATKTYTAAVSLDFEPVTNDRVYLTAELPNCFEGGKVRHGVVCETVEGALTAKRSNVAYVDSVKYGTSFDFSETAIGTVGTFYLGLDGTIVDFSTPEQAPTATKYAVLFDGGFTRVGTTTAIGGAALYATEVKAILEDNTTGVYTVAAVPEHDDEGNLTGKTTATFDPEELFDETDGDLAELSNTDPDDPVHTSETNYLVTYDLNDKNEIIIKSVVAEIGTDGAVSTNKFGTTQVNGNYILTSTIGFLQTNKGAYESGTGEETWTVIKGASLATKINKDLSPTQNVTQVLGGDFGSGKSITVLAALQGAIVTDGETADADLYYILSSEELVSGTSSKPTYSVIAYNSTTDKAELMTATAPTDGIAAGKMYEKFAEGAGFSSEIDDDMLTGFIAKEDEIVGSNQLEIVDGTGAHKEGFILKDTTKYYQIDTTDSTTEDGNESCALKITDLGNQTPVANSYQALVVSTTDDNGNKVATKVIVFTAPRGVAVSEDAATPVVVSPATVNEYITDSVSAEAAAGFKIATGVSATSSREGTDEYVIHYSGTVASTDKIPEDGIAGYWPDTDANKYVVTIAFPAADAGTKPQQLKDDSWTDLQNTLSTDTLEDGTTCCILLLAVDADTTSIDLKGQNSGVVFHLDFSGVTVAE